MLINVFFVVIIYVLALRICLKNRGNKWAIILLTIVALVIAVGPVLLFVYIGDS